MRREASDRMSLATANPNDLAIILIDVQPYFLDKLPGDQEPLLVRFEQLLIVAEWFVVPVLATFERPLERKQQLPARVQRLFPGTGRTLTKHTYDLCSEPEIDAALHALGRTQFAVVGGETDVCVLQSVLGLRRRGWDVFLLEDCLFSREPNVGAAVRRMERAGAIVSTYKTLFYELCQTDDAERWAEQQAVAESRGFIPVESLPPRIV
jgi:nicotinamidase-related amidase